MKFTEYEELKDNIICGKSFIGKDLTNANFEGKDLSDCDFTQSNLTNSNFKNSTLTRTIFKNANLSGVDFSDAVFNQVDLTRANCEQAKLRNTHINDSKVDSTNLACIKFEGTKFTNTLGRQVRFYRSDFIDGSKLISCRFTYSDFTKARFINSTLLDSYFIGSSFQLSKFDNSRMNNCKMRRVNFSFSKLVENNNLETENTFVDIGFETSSFVGCIFKGIKLEKCSFNHSFMVFCSFKNKTILKECNVQYCNLSGSHFNDCNILNTSFVRSFMLANEFYNTHIKGSDSLLSSVNLQASNVINCKWSNISMSRSYFTHVKPTGSIFEEVDFTGAELVGTLFGTAEVPDCTFNRTIGDSLNEEQRNDVIYRKNNREESYMKLYKDLVNGSNMNSQEEEEEKDKKNSSKQKSGQNDAALLHQLTEARGDLRFIIRQMIEIESIFREEYQSTDENRKESIKNSLLEYAKSKFSDRDFNYIDQLFHELNSQAFLSYVNNVICDDDWRHKDYIVNLLDKNYINNIPAPQFIDWIEDGSFRECIRGIVTRASNMVTALKQLKLLKLASCNT